MPSAIQGKPVRIRRCPATVSRSGDPEMVSQTTCPPRPTPFARKGKDTMMRILPPRRVACSLAAVGLAVATLLTAASPITAQEATPPVAHSESTASTHVSAASSWLRAQQDASGGFPGFDGTVDAGTTTDAAMALFAAQTDDPDAAVALESAVAYLEQEGDSYAASGAGQAAKVALAAIAGGRNPRDFGGDNLLEAMHAVPTTTVENPIPDIYGDDLYDHALVLLAMAAMQEPIPDEAIAAIRDTQAGNGGWAFDGSTEDSAADSNTTALMLQALVAAGLGDDEMVSIGIEYLHTLQLPDGSGFAYGPADPMVADANSTALVVQALIAAGEDPASPDWGNAALSLVKFQLPDGSLRYLPTDDASNLLATLQAIPAMAGIPLPVAAACAEAMEIPACVPLDAAA